MQGLPRLEVGVGRSSGKGLARSTQERRVSIAQSGDQLKSICNCLGSGGRYLEMISRVAAVAASLGILLMMLGTSADVGRRFLLDRPILGVIELNQLLMVLVVFMALAHTQVERGHIQVELSARWLSPRWRSATVALGCLVGLALFVPITIKGAEMAWSAWVNQDYSWGAVHFPLWPSRIFVPLGSGLLCLYLAVDLWRQVRASFRPQSKRERSGISET